MAAYFGPNPISSLNGGATRIDPCLPHGGCNYRALSGGGSLSTCGCKRFWLKDEENGQQQRPKAWCYCGHHACFHDHIVASSATSKEVRAADANSGLPDISPPWELERDKVSLSARQALYPGTEQSVSHSAAGLGIMHTSQAQQQSLNTRLWQALDGFARGEKDIQRPLGALDLPPTRDPTVTNEPCAISVEVMPGGHQLRSRPMNLSSHMPLPFRSDNDINMEECSATEIATPSILGTPDLRATMARPGAPTNIAGALSPEPSIGRDKGRVGLQESLMRGDTQPAVPMSVREMENTIRAFGRRISVLESMSFDHMPSGEVHERLEMVDARLIDLETWRMQLDEARPSPQDDKVQERQIREPSLSRDDDSVASDCSFDSNAAAQTEAVVLATLAASSEIRPRVDALEARIADLETAAMPSFMRPWHIQVILLPFGRHLAGIWEPATDLAQHLPRHSHEWSGVQDSLRPSSLRVGHDVTWTTESIESWASETRDDWLSPKACGPHGVVFQRLASRGFVRDITITAPDARHISQVLLSAFQDVLARPTAVPVALAKRYRALQEPVVPLRKIRRSTHLEYLSKEEMSTPALWTADFLDTSVFMKVDEECRRLYLTTPHAYLQTSVDESWSWHMIKSLPMIDEDRELRAAQHRGRVIESCWTYNDRLDHVDVMESSFSDQEFELSSRSQSPAASSSAAREHLDNSHRMNTRALSSPAAKSAAPAAVPKRRVVSHDLAHADREPVAEGLSKRRRISASPELERHGVNFTPRWSREPSLPYMVDDAAPSRVPCSADGKRGITPTAYATPHSHFDSSRHGDMASEPGAEHPRVPDGHEEPEEWEGVQDSATFSDHGCAHLGDENDTHDDTHPEDQE